MTTTHEVLDSVRDQYGITFTEVGTGGGCMALEARLESGHWIVATDEGLCSFANRVAYESTDGTDDDNYQSRYGNDGALGWSIGIYVNDPVEDTWMSSGEDTVVDVVDYNAFAADLPVMVGRALAALAGAR